MSRHKKKEKRYFNKKNIVGLFIAFIMVSSLLAMWEGGVVEKYNGFKIKTDGISLQTKINGEWVDFGYSPSNLDDMDVSSEAMLTLENSNMVYFTFDPEDKLLSDIELTRMILGESLEKNFNIYAPSGVTEQIEPYAALPLIDCSNATSTIPVVYFKYLNETKISIENNCIYVYAQSGYDFEALTERIKYGLYGVIE
ncbi:hypothetical protein HN695_03190 [Candidatus Woesearchaeota archaeon]|nr:hypothetical protein [Candidatus Woesearchaeota archaeon]MBT5271781.1 hypothetical protein [Candidatus Woesearchaeota archaeon]MBT6336299.1 hypothetical protein [Candidatus Woesearchaeota archaeon]MBT7927315.1 hypothetical protein [Candidatus Woesearchaeota archaeon]